MSLTISGLDLNNLFGSLVFSSANYTRTQSNPVCCSSRSGSVCLIPVRSRDAYTLIHLPHAREFSPSYLSCCIYICILCTSNEGVNAAPILYLKNIESEQQHIQTVPAGNTIPTPEYIYAKTTLFRRALSHLGEPHADLVLGALAAVASVDQVPPDADAVVPAQRS